MRGVNLGHDALAGVDTCVVMPTYSERGNLETTLADLFAHNPHVHVLVVDDNSPDGTGVAADAMAAHDARIHVLNRPGKEGLGPAYIAGFRQALARGYEFICEMDMDGSHRGVDLATMLGVIRRNKRVALVVGSRRVAGGSTENWPLYRDLLSRCGSWYARTMLSLPVRDVTSGLRVYRAEVLGALEWKHLESNGYVFQIDMTRRVAAAGGLIQEVPITFAERVHGNSKMSLAIIAEAMARVTQWGFQRLAVGRME